MAQLAQWTEKKVVALHGMTPKRIRMLREGLAAQRRHFGRVAR